MTNRRRRDAAGTGLVLAEQPAAVEPAAWSGLLRGLVELLAANKASRPPAHSDSCWSHLVRTFLNYSNI